MSNNFPFRLPLQPGAQPGVSIGDLIDGSSPSVMAPYTPAPAPAPSPAPAPAPAPSPLRPKFFVGPADAYAIGTQGYLDAAIYLSGSSASGKSGTFSLTTTAGNYGWLAVDASASAAGVMFFDGMGSGGWSGAGRPGNYSSGATLDTSSVTVTDGATGALLRLFRQDYINADPTPRTYTTS